jgi:hypothetical protein
MRVLFVTGTPANYMAPPRLGDEQIVCGPDWADQRLPDGRWISLRTPVGEFNLSPIAAKLPLAQKPDVIVCLVDASWRCLPRGLAAFKCPKVLLVADTHHLQQPLLGMLRYATTEPFTRVVLLYDRHHAGFFHSAGLRNVFWFPGLTFPHDDATVLRARQTGERTNHIAFVGQAGKFHPRRARLLDALRQGGLPVEQRSVPQAEALQFYGKSGLVFNASLNGDLNLRVFEVLAAGSVLLTDRLASNAGLDHMLQDGRDLLCYGSAGELVERAGEALRNPSARAAIGAAGARWFDENFTQKHRMTAFQSLVTDGTVPQAFEFSAEEKILSYFPGAMDRLLQAGRFYEVMQEMHRNAETLKLAFAPGVPPGFGTFCATLPRVNVAADLNADGIDISVLSLADADGAEVKSRYLCFWDAKVQDRPMLGAKLGPSWSPLSDVNAVFFQRQQTK